jgi:hypothetical protein
LIRGARYSSQFLKFWVSYCTYLDSQLEADEVIEQSWQLIEGDGLPTHKVITAVILVVLVSLFWQSGYLQWFVVEFFSAISCACS